MVGVYNGTTYTLNKTTPFKDTYTFLNNANGWKLICFNFIPSDENLLSFSHWFTTDFISNEKVSKIDIISNDIQYRYRDGSWNKEDDEMLINIQISYYVKIQRSDTVNETSIVWEGYLIDKIKFDNIKNGENIYMSSFTSNEDGVSMDDIDSISEPDTGLIENSTFYVNASSSLNGVEKYNNGFNHFIKSVYTFSKTGFIIKQDYNPDDQYFKYNLVLRNKIGISVKMEKQNLAYIDIMISNKERNEELDTSIRNNLNLNIDISI